MFRCTAYAWLADRTCSVLLQSWALAASCLAQHHRRRRSTRTDGCECSPLWRRYACRQTTSTELAASARASTAMTCRIPWTGTRSRGGGAAAAAAGSTRAGTRAARVAASGMTCAATGGTRRCRRPEMWAGRRCRMRTAGGRSRSTTSGRCARRIGQHRSSAHVLRNPPFCGRWCAVVGLSCWPGGAPSASLPTPSMFAPAGRGLTLLPAPSRTCALHMCR